MASTYTEAFPRRGVDRRRVLRYPRRNGIRSFARCLLGMVMSQYLRLTVALFLVFQSNVLAAVQCGADPVVSVIREAQATAENDATSFAELISLEASAYMARYTVQLRAGHFESAMDQVSCLISMEGGIDAALFAMGCAADRMWCEANSSLEIPVIETKHEREALAFVRSWLRQDLVLPSVDSLDTVGLKHLALLAAEDVIRGVHAARHPIEEKRRHP